ncbi:ROK family protein [Deinococcus cellulosilyticus]|uniref:Glucokinase n=1 Tax=Deinococcus cellulosilyticus (strain DSM 18568 / NBRC 106333 / KACC 11606 / 5516J-15) TaxID=1223518 RepID=A0A511MV18_DEIC1|nr:ROK family protein [Deinococcus cellulosilyticus]GEM44433.1 glucokinase [Deinococcus cellulosilyticus NBRC 106333 = KACC 11606]
MKHPSKFALCLDVGGSHVTAAPIDLTNRTLLETGRVREHIRHFDPLESVIRTWWSALSMAALACEGADISHITVAVPAPFDYAQGISHMTHKYRSLYGEDVGAHLRRNQQYSPLDGIPILFANDADLFALGEHWAGVGQTFDRIIGITLGTGLGSGFIRQGRVITQGQGVPEGGELWNTPYLDVQAERYACGQAVTDFYQHLRGENCTAQEICHRADHGDPHARKAYWLLGEHLSAILLPHAQAFEAQAVVIGGNVSRAWNHFSPALQAGLPGVQVHPSRLLEDATLLGGAALIGTLPEVTR